MNVPSDPRGSGPSVDQEGEGLTGGPFLLKVDRYGSVSGLVRVRVALGTLVIVRSNEAGSLDRSFSLEV